MEVPKPGPEHKALEFFAGKWVMEHDVKPGPHGPGFKEISQDTNEWFEGGFHLICRNRCKGSNGELGPVRAMGIFAYSVLDEAYTWYGISSTGGAGLSKIIKRGNTWTFTSKKYVRGEWLNTRNNLVEISSTVYTFRVESSSDGESWTTIMEGKGTKIGP